MISNPASEAQVNYLRDLRRKRDPEAVVVPFEKLEEALSEEALSKPEASALIDQLLAVRPVLIDVEVPDTPRTDADFAKLPVLDLEAFENRVRYGTFTIVRSDGTYRTLQIGEPAWADGKTVASYLSGSDNEYDYTAFAFIYKGTVRPFKRFASNDELISDLEFLLGSDQDEAHERFLGEAEKYALESGRCLRCNRTLTVPTSLHRGLGPVCAGIEGI